MALAKKTALPAKKVSKATIESGEHEFKHVEGEIVHGDAVPIEDAPVEDLHDSLDLLDPELTGAPLTALTPAADPIARYLNEIGRYPILTREQEHETAIRYREDGDALAAEKLVTANLRFVVKVAAEYSRFGARLIDLVQEGNVGLMHAVREFNPYKGTRLITYAVWWIRGYIQEYLMRQYSMVRIGTTATQRKLFYQLQRQREELERMGLERGIAQLSGRLGVDPDEVKDMHARLRGRDLSLDAPVGEEGSSSLLDLQSEVDPHSIVDDLGRREELTELGEKLETLRPTLSERELVLLDERILADEPLTLQEIGDKYGTTREAVRQMEARLMAKIKKSVVGEPPQP